MKDKWLKKVDPQAASRPKELITLRLEPHVVAWFRGQSNYNALINSVLKAYMTYRQQQQP
jgi:uncharacterized protein (DUF4415 family)